MTAGSARRLVAIVVASGLVAVACGGSDDAAVDDVADSAPAVSEQPSPPTESDVASDTDDSVTTDAPATSEAPVATDAPVTTSSPIDDEAPASDDAPRWNDPTGTYSVAFPDGAEPQASDQLVPLPDGQTLDVIFYVVEFATGATTSTLFDYTPIIGDDFVVDLQGAVDGAIGNVAGAELTSQTERVIQGRDAIEYEFTLPGGSGRALVVENGPKVAIQLQALGASPGEFSSFIDTFQFNEDR